MVEVGVTNPTDVELTVEVTLEGHGLTGASSLDLAPKSREVYQVAFTPTAIGHYDGRSVLKSRGRSWFVE